MLPAKWQPSELDGTYCGTMIGRVSYPSAITAGSGQTVRYGKWRRLEKHVSAYQIG
jgi:hypothetical protein